MRLSNSQRRQRQHQAAGLQRNARQAVSSNRHHSEPDAPLPSAVSTGAHTPATWALMRLQILPSAGYVAGCA